MENATKALLIAGAILIAIVLISVGMNLLNSTSETTGQAQATMDATAVAAFNNQFAGYLNQNISKAKCTSLIQRMIASNATNKSHIIYWGSTGTTLPTAASVVAADGTYLAVYSGDGYITHIYKQP